MTKSRFLSFQSMLVLLDNLWTKVERIQIQKGYTPKCPGLIEDLEALLMNGI